MPGEYGLFCIAPNGHERRPTARHKTKYFSHFVYNATSRSLSERTHTTHVFRGSMFASFFRCLSVPTGAVIGSSGAFKDSYPEDVNGEGRSRRVCFLRCFADVLEEQEGVTALPRRLQRNSDGGCSRVVLSKRRPRIASYNRDELEIPPIKNRHHGGSAYRPCRSRRQTRDK